MKSRFAAGLVVIVAACCLPEMAQAQRFGVGVTSVNGVPTGGFFSVGGVITGGGRYVRMNINASASELVGVNTFSFQNGGGFGGGGFGGFPGGGFGSNGGFAAGGNFGGGFGGGASNVQASARPVPTVDGFMLAAKKFDEDEDDKFDQKELATMGLAVWKELEKLNAPVTRPAKTKGPKKHSKSEEEIDQAVREAFVKRCMTFDADHDELLDEKETKRMAAALIRTLLKA